MQIGYWTRNLDSDPYDLCHVELHDGVGGENSEIAPSFQPEESGKGAPREWEEIPGRRELEKGPHSHCAWTDLSHGRVPRWMCME